MDDVLLPSELFMLAQLESSRTLVGLQLYLSTAPFAAFVSSVKPYRYTVKNVSFANDFYLQL